MLVSCLEMKNKGLIRIGIVLHPLNMDDFYKKFPSFYPIMSILLRPFLLTASPFLAKTIYSKLPPHKVFETNIIEIKNKRIQIIAVMCPLFPEQLVLNLEQASKRVIESVQLLVKLGVQITTLAGFSSIVTNGGHNVINSLNCCITSGNSLTAALTVECIEKALYARAQKLEDLKLAIIGATGDIGSVCSRIFAQKVRILTLCSRNIEKNHDFQKEITNLRRQDVFFTSDISSAIKEADVVITATSAFGSLIDPLMLKSQALVCDVSMPPNIPREVKFVRDDLLIFEGGRAKLDFFNKIKGRAWENLFPDNAVYGCLAEGIALALDDKFLNFSTGKGQLTEDKLKEINSIAKRNGISCLKIS
jgi:fatty aldehyde-generating acyl-ACP reductase